MTQDSKDDIPERDVRGRISDSLGSVWGCVRDKSRGVRKATAGHAERFGDQYRNSRAGELTASMIKQAGEGLDTVSGKAMYDLVKERLDLQDRYNDLLATKLQEALDRIDELEDRLDKSERRNPRHEDQ